MPEADIWKIEISNNDWANLLVYINSRDFPASVSDPKPLNICLHVRNSA